MLPYISSFYDTGFKVLSMKINYFAPSKLNTNIIDIYIFQNVVLIIRIIRIRKLYFDSAHNKTVQHKL